MKEITKITFDMDMESYLIQMEGILMENGIKGKWKGTFYKQIYI